MHTLVVILVLLSVVIVFVSLAMSPDSNAFSGALIGSNDLDLFRTSKELGFKKFLKWSMFSLGLSVLVISLISNLFFG